MSDGLSQVVVCRAMLYCRGEGRGETRKGEGREEERSVGWYPPPGDVRRSADKCCACVHALSRFYRVSACFFRVYLMYV
jgi:hypothetical protein